MLWGHVALVARRLTSDSLFLSSSSSSFFFSLTSPLALGKSKLLGVGNQLPVLNVELRLVPVAVALSVSLIMCYTDIAVILSGGVGKNGSTVAVSARSHFSL